MINNFFSYKKERNKILFFYTQGLSNIESFIFLLVLVIIVSIYYLDVFNIFHSFIIISLLVLFIVCYSSCVIRKQAIRNNHSVFAYVYSMKKSEFDILCQKCQTKYNLTMVSLIFSAVILPTFDYYNKQPNLSDNASKTVALILVILFYVAVFSIIYMGWQSLTNHLLDKILVSVQAQKNN